MLCTGMINHFGSTYLEQWNYIKMLVLRLCPGMQADAGCSGLVPYASTTPASLPAHPTRTSAYTSTKSTSSTPLNSAKTTTIQSLRNYSATSTCTTTTMHATRSALAHSSCGNSYERECYLRYDHEQVSESGGYGDAREGREGASQGRG